jgi:hypothetical protein
MVIVDTTVWVDYLRGVSTPQAEWLDVELAHQRLGLLDITLYEVLQGVRHERHLEEVRQALEQFAIFPTGSVELALAAVQNAQTLRAVGQGVPNTVACLIATFCLTHNHILLHNDRVFDSFEHCLGLTVVKTASGTP